MKPDERAAYNRLINRMIIEELVRRDKDAGIVYREPAHCPECFEGCPKCSKTGRGGGKMKFVYELVVDAESDPSAIRTPESYTMDLVMDSLEYMNISATIALRQTLEE